MASQKKRPSDEPTKPLNLDEAFGRKVSFTDVPHRRGEIVPIPTGLSDEDDAGRHLALQFDNEIWLCPNCEALWRNTTTHQCPYCGINLGPKDMRPDRRKRGLRYK